MDIHDHAIAPLREPEQNSRSHVHILELFGGCLFASDQGNAGADLNLVSFTGVQIGRVMPTVDFLSSFHFFDNKIEVVWPHSSSRPRNLVVPTSSLRWLAFLRLFLGMQRFDAASECYSRHH